MDGALGDGGELLVGKGDAAGDADAGLAGLDEGELGGGGAEGVGCGAAGGEGAVVELGLDEDEAVGAAEFGDGAGEELLPGEGFGVAVEDALQRGVEAVEGGGEGTEIGALALDAHRDEAEGGEQAAGAGVGGELAEEGLGVDGLVEEFAEGVLVEEEEAVAVEEGGVVGAADGVEVGGVCAEGGFEAGGGGFGFFGGLGVDDGDDEVVELGEELPHFGLLPLPGQGGGEQLVDIGGDAEVVGGEVEAERGEEQGDEEDGDRAPGREADGGGDAGRGGARHGGWLKRMPGGGARGGRFVFWRYWLGRRARAGGEVGVPGAFRVARGGGCWGAGAGFGPAWRGDHTALFLAGMIDGRCGWVRAACGGRGRGGLCRGCARWCRAG